MKKSLERLVKTLTLSLGISVGVLGFSNKAKAQCNQPFTPDQYTIALWHFDENSGSTTYDATQNYTGQIKRYPNTLEPNLWTNGIFNSALMFDGQSYVEVNPSPY